MNRKSGRIARRGLLYGSLFGGTVVLGFAGLVAFSVYIEGRSPSGDKRSGLLPSVQRAVTKPIVDRISRVVEDRVRARAEAIYMDDGLTLDETIRRFLDGRVDLIDRRIYAYRLARVGSPECVAALLKVLETAPPEHKTFMIQLVGSTGNPAAKSWLWLMLEDPNQQVVMATIRSLGVIGGNDVTDRIAGILSDDQRDAEVRAAAAFGLGTIRTPAARAILEKALEKTESADVSAQILNSLGRFEFSAVADAFERFLASPEKSSTMRVTAVEALSASSGEAVPFLLNIATADADDEVRASAAWAISAHPQSREFGAKLTELAEKEQTVDVRRRLYEALAVQDEVSPDRLLTMVQDEEDVAARVAGFNAIARAANQQRGSAAAAVFDQEIVPELLQIATTSDSLNLRMRAVFALRGVQSDAARNALGTIASSDSPQVATAARNGFSTN